VKKEKRSGEGAVFKAEGGGGKKKKKLGVQFQGQKQGFHGGTAFCSNKKSNVLRR